MKRIISISSLLIFLALNVVAQEEAVVNDLKWLPNAEYCAAGYSAPEEYLANCPEDVKKYYYDYRKQKSVNDQPESLPLSMRGKWSRMTYGVMSEIEIKKAGKRLVERKFDGRFHATIGLGNYFVETLGKQSDLRVYHFKNLGELCKEAVKSGHLVKTGSKLFDYPAFMYKHHMHERHLLVKYSDEVLLYAPDEEYILRMLKTVEGKEKNILKNPNYKRLKGFSQSGVHSWDMRNGKTLGVVLKKYLYLKDPNNAKGREVADQILNEGRYILSSYIWNEQGIRVEYNQVFFDTPEQAAKEMAAEKLLSANKIKNRKTDKMDARIEKSKVYSIENSTLKIRTEYPSDWYRYQVDYIVAKKKAGGGSKVLWHQK